MILKSNKSVLLVFSFLIVAQLVLATQFALAEASGAPDATQRITNVLSAYGVNRSVSELVEVAGGEDKLAAILLQTRLNRETPFVGSRSEQMLLKFAARPEVMEALKGDLSSQSNLNFSRIIITHLDEVPDQAARAELARLGLTRASTDADFVPYARMLTFSSDSKLQELGAQLPQVVR